MKLLKLRPAQLESGSTLIVALSTILVLSIAGAGVLMNSTTRYNATSKQVKGWKEALYAAEAGGDLGFAQVRKYALDSTGASGFAAADGWAAPAPSPLPTTYSWNLGHTTTAPAFGEDGGLSAKVTVDRFAVLPGSNPVVGYYRIRSVGTAQVAGLKRVGMDNRMDALTKGDSLLRKIDFNTDHFISTFGFGDALPTTTATSANGKLPLVAVQNPDKPQVSRRIELIAIPVMPIEGAVKTAGSFRGTLVDSYDSKNGTYKGSNPAPPYDVDAHDGDVVVGNSTFSAGQVYGDVATNGGSATTTNVTGVVDNNVPTVVPTATPGVNPIPLMPSMAGGPIPESGSPSTISPPLTTYAIGTPQEGQIKRVFWYVYSSVDGVTINPVKTSASVTLPNGTVIPANTPLDTTVNLYVTGNVAGITVNKGATANIYFRGNVGDKARDFDNLNVDGPGTAPNYNSVWVPDYDYNPTPPSGTPKYTLKSSPNAPYVPSALVSRAGHMWFYGISPADGSTRTIDINPPGTVYAGFYAPSHDFSVNGNPDIYGVIVCKSFYMNGNCTFHFDKQLAALTIPLDYRVASYIEDVR
jgi:hypothetical protein